MTHTAALTKEKDRIGNKVPATERLNWFGRLNLIQQFAIAGSVVIVIGMAIVGRWVVSEIEEGVINSTSATTALYIDAVLGPVIPDLLDAKVFKDSTRVHIDRILERSEFGQRVVSIKIWNQSGLIIYSTQHDLVGRQFVPTDHLKKAWTGFVSAEFDSLHDAEDKHERASNLPLLEMYMPVRSRSSREIIAVAEFYILAETLRRDLHAAQFKSWMLVAVVTLGMFAALFGIVANGNRTILHQQVSLKHQVSRLTKLLNKNLQLSKNLKLAQREATTINERFLRRIGADLHDGPAQLIGHALLRLDTLKNTYKTTETSDQPPTPLETVRVSLKEALGEIRRQSAGLALVEIDNAPLKEALQLAISRHEKLTRTQVKRNLDLDYQILGHVVTVTAYRFVQEALNNCFRHAGSCEQQVDAYIENDEALHISVSDRGPGPGSLASDSAGKYREDGRIGLASLRNRIEAIGGTMNLAARQHGGTRVSMTVNLQEAALQDV